MISCQYWAEYFSTLSIRGGIDFIIISLRAALASSSAKVKLAPEAPVKRHLP